MQEANLLKMTGSFGTGKSCSEQWSRTGYHKFMHKLMSIKI